MASVGRVLKNAADSVLHGASHSRDKLPQFTGNIATHIDDVIKKTKGNDKYDAGPRRDELGRYTPNPDRDIDSTYDRPSGWRAGMRDKTWNDAAVNGVVRDPVTRRPLDPNEPWVMGHAPGYEFRHHQRSAQERGISREEFLDEYYNQTRFRPESPHTSSSGKHELGWEQYVGPGSPFI